MFKRVYVSTHLDIAEGTVTNIKNEFEKEDRINNSNTFFSKEKEKVCKEKIIPLLNHLGYSSDEYIEDKALQMGNVNNETSNKYRPDFRVLDNCEVVGDYLNTAPITIEAKFVGEADTNLKNAYEQAVTYARRLCSSYIIIATQYEIRLYHSENNYITKTLVFQCLWSNLINDENEFKKLQKQIGRDHFKFNGRLKYWQKK